jgi:hypothetical protein
VERFITSGAAVWLILGVMVVEAVVLSRLIRAFPGILAGLLAGGFIVAALGAALTGLGALVIALCLASSFVCHAIEIYFWFRLRHE